MAQKDMCLVWAWHALTYPPTGAMGVIPSEPSLEGLYALAKGDYL